jgi:hypothetical protein
MDDYTLRDEDIETRKARGGQAHVADADGEDDTDSDGTDTADSDADNAD